jgi:hypothetical protein
MVNPKEYLFTVTGGFDISPELVEFEAWDGGVIGFTLPGGRIAKLSVALEISSPDPDDDGLEYVTCERRMAELGFGNLDYDALDFHESNY